MQPAHILFLLYGNIIITIFFHFLILNLCYIPKYSHSYKCHNNTFICILLFCHLLLPLEEDILQNIGGLMNNNLINKIARIDIDDDELEKLNLTSYSYYIRDTLIETLQNKKGTFTVLSVNCQSIKAKYDKILLLIEQLKQYDLYFSIICLQISWLI